MKPIVAARGNCLMLFTTLVTCLPFARPQAAWAVSDSGTSRAELTGADQATPIPIDQIGAVAGKQYQGDGLSVTATPDGAWLRCIFQRLDGEATREGLWLTSAVKNQPQDRFRVMASSVGRTDLAADVSPLDSRRTEFRAGSRRLLRGEGSMPHTGEVWVGGQVTRFIRPGLVEEYSASMDGVRQDFVVLERPDGAGELRVELDVAGARVEPRPDGARLVLEGSGRKIAYSRLRATDATGKELEARMEMANKSEIGLAVVVDDAGAMYPVRIDPTFSDDNWISLNPSIPGADGSVLAAAVDGSGNLYIGGYFTFVGNVIANNVARWDGSSWLALGSGVNHTVWALAVSGSNLYVGGSFTNAGGSAANRVAKWNGSSWSALGSGLNGTVNALAVSGSVLYAGGCFTMMNGSHYLAQWNGSGWGSVSSTPLDGPVYALAVSGSDLYVGGFFFEPGANPLLAGVAKWDGRSLSPLGSGLRGVIGSLPSVVALAVSGSDLYVGGRFGMAGGSLANYVAKWDGNSWSALGSGLNGAVAALTVSGNDLYVGGYFTTAGGSAAINVAKWNGTSWSALGSGVGGFSPSVSVLAVWGSDLYMGGRFATAGGSAAINVAKWNGSSWSALGSGLNRPVGALAVSGSGLYVGGEFASAGGSAANCMAKWNGSGWSALGLGVSDAPPGYDTPVVNALAVSGSDLYAGGTFTTAGGSAANHVAKWNGTSWSALGGGVGGVTYPYGPHVHALTVSGNDLYVGGYFTTAGGSAANCVAKWNGSSWAPLSSGMSGTVYALAASGSDLYVGGDFTTAGGSAANYVAKWNGTSWSALGSGLNGRVRALAVSGNELYVGGEFTTAGGSPATGVAKWDENRWSALGAGVGGVTHPSVVALVVLGRSLYVGGDFTTAGGSAASYVAKWDGTSWSALGSGLSRIVYALAVSENDLYVGGYFTTAGGKLSAYVAKAVLPPEPSIAVLGNGTEIADGDTSPSLADSTDFGSAAVGGGMVLRTFTIRNSGTADLNLTGTPKVAVSGPQAADFTVALQPTSPVAAGDATTFQVTFAPGGTGLRTATLNIPNDVAAGNPHDFVIQGTGVGLTARQASGWLELTWPESYRGWELEVQTNRNGVDSGAVWYPVPGSKTNTHMNLPIDSAMPCVFYRLRF